MDECKVCQEALSEDDYGTNSEPTRCTDCGEYVHFDCGINVNWGYVCNECRKYD